MVHTCMFEFRIGPIGDSINPEVLKKVEGLGAVALAGQVDGAPLVVDMGGPLDKLIICKTTGGSHASVRLHSDGLITLDVQHSTLDRNSSILTYITALQIKLENHLGSLCIKSQTRSLLTSIRRGEEVHNYMVLTDERLVETDYDAVLVNTDSQWQNIKIAHSKAHGNCLLLDEDIMLGESDLIYTTTLTGVGGRESYRGKEVLILGGGDGGILYELLKEDPAMVVMVEIDEEVIKACRTHMRSVCEDAMDTYEGPNKKILIQDCVAYLHDCIQSGKKFDFVINDLTEFPVDKAVKGYGYDLETTSAILELSLKVVKQGGKTLARGNGLAAKEYRDLVEKNIHQLGAEFKRRDVMVPSFREIYCLYEIWKKEN